MRVGNMFVCTSLMRRNVSCLLISTIHEAKVQMGPWILSVIESGKTRVGKGEKQNGHIHYLHTQAGCRSTSRWPDRSALTTPGGRGQVHSWSASDFPGQSYRPNGCHGLGSQGHHKFPCWFLWTRTKQTSLFSAWKKESSRLAEKDTGPLLRGSSWAPSIRRVKTDCV